MLVLVTPTVCRLVGYENRKDELRRHLKYVDKSVDYQITKFKNGRGWFTNKYGAEEYEEKLKELKELRLKTMLFEDEHGMWTYSGIVHRLADMFDDKIVREYEFPEAKIIPWAKVPEHAERYYQTAAKDKLLEIRHGGVEIGTGLGKSFIILHLVKQLGLKTVVMAPSTSIAMQLYDDLCEHLGKKRVGFVGDGKKQYDRLVTVAIGASLTRLEPGSDGWEHLSKADVFIADESHLCPADTLTKVCFGLVSNAPYRFFFSGTQMRNDGLDMLLDGITGKIVHTMTVQEGVDQGFLAKPIFRMVRLDSAAQTKSSDPNALTRTHVYYNPQVIKLAAEFANKAVSLMERPTLILIDELEQFSYLLPYLRYEARFAHGGVTKENKKLVPEAYHKSDPKQLVEDFNNGEFPILIGTSCIAIGTNFKNVKFAINLRGGRSPIELKQAVGRTTRLVENKVDCIFTDFAIDNIEALARHAKARKEIYAEIYPSYSEMRVNV